MTQDPPPKRQHRYNAKSRANLIQYRDACEPDTAPICNMPAPRPIASTSTAKQDLARDIVNMAAPEAAAYLASVVRGQGSARRAPVKTRVDAAVRILEMAGVKSDVAGSVPVDDLSAAELTAFIEAGARATTLRRASEKAVDVDASEATGRGGD